MGRATPCLGDLRADFGGRFATRPLDALGERAGALFLASRSVVCFAAFRVVFLAAAALADAGVAPCGLGARDTLRLEAGMNLYGNDMDESQSPLESGLGWTIAWEPAERDFIGRSALETQRQAGGLRRFVGLVLEGRGVLRDHQRLFDGEREIGEITSGGFSPSLQRSIALARVAADIGDACEVEIRGKRLAVRRVRPPFVRNGQAQIEL